MNINSMDNRQFNCLSFEELEGINGGFIDDALTLAAGLTMIGGGAITIFKAAGATAPIVLGGVSVAPAIVVIGGVAACVGGVLLAGYGISKLIK